ncbi:MAG: putative maturation protein [Alehxovirus nemorisadaptatum]|uniref:Maturation protein n=1 Tax=Leviviridae sp. TaxID=2027243 RepID=A0ABY3SU44_9VIRU|nr:MAG: putative maturation protein [Leviviridae sp.]
MSRTRTSSYSWPGGGKRQHFVSGNPSVDQTQGPISPFVKSVCIDDVGRGVDHGLSITHTDLSGIVPLNGESASGIHLFRYSNWMPDLNAAAPSPLSALTLPSAASIATTTLATSNPSRPSVGSWNFVYELKDLPGMLHEIGKLKLLRHYAPKELAKEIAKNGTNPKFVSNLHLSIVMGWRPLISDLRKMVDFKRQVDNRMQDLDILFNKNGGLHRSVGKENSRKGISARWSETRTSSSTALADTGTSQIISVRRDLVTTTKMWGTVRWTNPFPKNWGFSDPELRQKAFGLVYGFTLTPKQIWDSFPWSWLIDWVLNVGDYLDTYNNILSLSPSTPCVMTWIRTTESWTRTDGNLWATGAYGTRLLESKARILQGATLTASIPFLGPGQLATLGALAIQRSR